MGRTSTIELGAARHLVCSSGLLMLANAEGTTRSALRRTRASSVSRGVRGADRLGCTWLSGSIASRRIALERPVAKLSEGLTRDAGDWLRTSPSAPPTLRASGRVYPASPSKHERRSFLTGTDVLIIIAAASETEVSRPTADQQVKVTIPNASLTARRSLVEISGPSRCERSALPGRSKEN
jgi:hypothetical protein